MEKKMESTIYGTINIRNDKSNSNSNRNSDTGSSIYGIPYYPTRFILHETFTDNSGLVRLIHGEPKGGTIWGIGSRGTDTA